MYKGTILQHARSCRSPVHLSTKVLRCLLWVILAIYAVAAIGFLGLRYWVLPRIDQWRPQIEQYAGEALGARVEIGGIAADWSGLNPRLRLSAVRIYEGAQDPPVLSLPSVGAVLAWRSMLRLSPQLLTLRIDAADLTLRRDPSGRLWVAGLSFEPHERASGRSPVLRWLAAQRQVGLYNATLRWRDEMRQAPELVFSDLDLMVRNGALSHRFGLRVQPPGALAAGLSVRGEFNRSLFALNGAEPANWTGRVYAQLDDAEPAAWAPWLDLRAPPGRLAARAWLDLARGQVQEVTLDGLLRGLQWQAAPQQGGESVSVREARVHLQGAPGDLLQVAGLPLGRSDGAKGVAVAAQVQGLRVAVPAVFETPAFDFAELGLDASVRRRPGQPLTLDLRQLRLANDDLDLRLQGAWRDEGRDAAGTADLRGSLARAAMPAIHRYLPREVNLDARTWLAEGLLAGEIRDAAVTLKGELGDFPYTAPGATGEFRISGAYRDAVVDYAPARPGRKGWPRLEGLAGGFAIDKVSLTLDSATGTVPTAPGRVVTLADVHAVIPDMEDNAELTVRGSSSGPAPAYLALAANSPLGGLLDGALDEAEATGDWQVPLDLHVPLMNVDDTRVTGEIAFQGGTFRLMPEIPVMSQLHGELEFSERGVQAREVRGVFLGGPARLWGKLGRGESLNFAGTLSASALDELSRAPGMKRFSGKTAYQGKLSYAKGTDIDVSVQSDLTGLAIDLPAPVGKPAAAALPLRLQWSPATDAGRAGRRWLSGGLGEQVNLLLERDRGEGATYFARGAVGIGRPATLPAQGLSLSGRLDTLDLGGWDDAGEAFTVPPVKGRAAAPPILPPLNLVSLQAGRLVSGSHVLDQLTLYAQRPAPSQWRVSIDSRQAAGTLEWTEASGAVAGKVLARMTRLALGGEQGLGGSGNGADDTAGNELSDIPAVDLQAKQLLLYGRDVGSLELVGTNMERGNLWRLDKLQIRNEAATLDAQGNWRLRGKDRGLTVDAQANFGDLGRFLDRIGFANVVSGGSGTVQANLTWRNLPWTHDLADLEGSARISLDKGRFMNVNSRTARLLELLSLQSLQRLAKLDFSPAGLLREGFPFDTVRGDVKLSRGVATTDGYKLNGPVAAIVLEGNTDIVAERWDMHAVVIPNLDASGAAVVTALAVNPLIGLGAFLTQWLLKQPLAQALTAQYKVSGSWDDPVVEPLETRPLRVRPEEPLVEH